MSNYDSSSQEQAGDMTTSQWFILALLGLLNAAVLVLLVLALTGQLTL